MALTAWSWQIRSEVTAAAVIGLAFAQVNLLLASTRMLDS
jgi:hypothetical protein